MRYNKYKAYLLILSLFGSTALFSQEDLKQNEKIQPAQNKAYFEDKERGWFWGEKKAEPKKKNSCSTGRAKSEKYSDFKR